MKIAFTGLKIDAGKVKYNDEILVELEKKFLPKKLTPYFFEFVPDDYEKSEAISISRENLLDLLILDIEKLETRKPRTSDPAEIAVIEKGMKELESEKPICDYPWTEQELPLIRMIAPYSLKPTYVCEDKSPDVNELIKKVMEKAAVMFFYTAGKQEVRSWFVRKGSDIVTCAGKIHTDLAKGFIKADIMNFKDLPNFHNLQDAQKKGLAKLVDRDYIIQEGDIIEIRFNV